MGSTDNDFIQHSGVEPSLPQCDKDAPESGIPQIFLRDGEVDIQAIESLIQERDHLRRENKSLRNHKRLGLVWETHEIEKEVGNEDKAIVPRLILEDNGQKVSHLNSNAGNMVIEGDNLDALHILSKTHKGKVDCIYIDPPYNTGQTTFVYNDKFVDPEHRWRKSLWLDFLYKRLVIARDLLSERGVILVSINDDHRAILELLMDEVMPGRRLGCMVWRSRQGTGLSGSGNLSTDHEHILVYGNAEFSFGGKEKSFDLYKYDDNDGRGAYRIDNMTLGFSHEQRSNLYYPIQNPDTGVWYPANPNRIWAYASASRLKPGQKIRTRTMEDLISDNKVWFPSGRRIETWNTMEELLAAIDAGDVPVNGRGIPLLRRGLPDLEFWVGRPVGWGVPQFKRHLRDVKAQNQPISSWIRSTADKGDESIPERVEIVSYMSGESDAHLKAIFGKKVFNYAKPPSLMLELLRQATQPDSLVLDFFAGSGTTAEAVLRLNDEDGGDRRFIMVSSTEATEKDPDKNICRDVCAPRIRSTCEGYNKGKKEIEGTGNGFAYLRLDRTPAILLARSLDDDAVWTILQTIHGAPHTTYSPVGGLMIDERGEASIALCPEITDETIDVLRRTSSGPMILYTEYPGYASKMLSGTGIEARPAYETAIRIAQK